MNRSLVLAALALSVALTGCGESAASGVWLGTIDTLPSGIVAVGNPKAGIWDPDPEKMAWRVRETLRVGTLEGEGPDLFGSIVTLEVDAQGRLWVFERQGQELRVFDTDGSHVRTIGREGGGPGEFKQVIGMDWGPDGHLWLLDPSNNRFTVIDTAGTVVRSLPAIGGWVYSPWPGGFDTQGRLYTYVPIPDAAGETKLHMVRYRVDSSLVPLDTIRAPEYTGERNFFELRSNGGFMRAGVRFSPNLQWRLSKRGTMWTLLTGEYRIHELTFDGDTIREITKAFDPLPVTGADVDSAIAGLEWFTRQGGKVDRSKFPSVKPAVEGMHPAEDGTLWVEPVVAEAGQRGRVFDVFDERGRYLGQVDMPFSLASYPPPIIRGGKIYGVTRDELEVSYVVVAEIVKESVSR